MRFLAALLLAGCVSSAGGTDMGTQLTRWDGHCAGKPGDLGRKVAWHGALYVCENPGKGDWRFIQHPYERINVRDLDGVVFGDEVEVLRD